MNTQYERLEITRWHLKFSQAPSWAARGVVGEVFPGLWSTGWGPPNKHHHQMWVSHKGISNIFLKKDIWSKNLSCSHLLNPGGEQINIIIFYVCINVSWLKGKVYVLYVKKSGRNLVLITYHSNVRCHHGRSWGRATSDYSAISTTFCESLISSK